MMLEVTVMNEEMVCRPPDRQRKRKHKPQEQCCATCNKTKPAREFFPAHTPSGLTDNCRPCIVTNAARDRADREQRQAAAEEAKRTADGVTVKRCAGCHQSKPFAEFGRHRSAKDGHRRCCMTCVASGMVNPTPRTENNRATDKALRTAPHRMEANRAAAASWRARNPEACRARDQLKTAVRSGVITRPNRCQVVGCKHVGKTHGHHHDYSLPLLVLWVCPGHHRQIHAGTQLEIIPGLPVELLGIPPTRPTDIPVVFAGRRSSERKVA